MSEIWGVALASAVIGAGASVYGANKQAKANKSAQDQNAAMQDDQNRMAWSNYLMSRGIAPTSPVEPGVIPGEGQYRAVNTRMPLWMNLNLPSATPRAPAGGAPQPVVRGTITRKT